MICILPRGGKNAGSDGSAPGNEQANLIIIRTGANNSLTCRSVRSGQIAQIYAINYKM